MLILRHGKCPQEASRHDRHPLEHAAGYTIWLACGGLEGDDLRAIEGMAMAALEQPLHIHDIHATILAQLGVNHTRHTHRFAGRHDRLTDVHGRVVREILA